MVKFWRSALVPVLVLAIAVPLTLVTPAAPAHAAQALEAQTTLWPPGHWEHVTKKRWRYVITAAGTPSHYTRCGFTSCSVYFSQWKTKSLEDDADIVGGLAGSAVIVICAAASKVVGVWCAAYLGADSVFALSALRRAEKMGGCLKVTYRLGYGFTFHAVSKSNRFCKR